MTPSQHQTLPTSATTTLGDVLRWRAAHQHDQVAYSFLSESTSSTIDLTYGELDRRARALSALDCNS
jgi:acyl-CoA synthetase (AMP-forming)/AMP-acid ligase II